MITAIDHIIIAVENLKEAEANYELLLGHPPVWKGTHKHLGTENSLFIFKNTNSLKLLSKHYLYIEQNKKMESLVFVQNSKPRAGTGRVV